MNTQKEAVRIYKVLWANNGKENEITALKKELDRILAEHDEEWKERVKLLCDPVNKKILKHFLKEAEG